MRAYLITIIAIPLFSFFSTANGKIEQKDKPPVPGFVKAASLDSLCMPSDTGARAFLRWTRRIASDTIGHFAKLRGAVGVPLTPADDVNLVVDEGACARASLAADSAGNVPGPTHGRVHLVQIGTGYFAIHRPDWVSGEGSMVFFVDSTWGHSKAIVLY